MTLTPPEEIQQPLQLETTKPVEKVAPEKASGLIPALTQTRELEISSQANQLASHAITLNPHSPEFGQLVKDVQSLGHDQVVSSSEGPNRLLQSRSSSVSGSHNAGDATQKVAGTLAELRSTVEDLTPNAADLTGVQKFLGLFPGGKKIRKYFQKYENAQGQLDHIVKSLLAGQDELMKDNASLEQEKRLLWKNMGELNEYIVFAEKMDDSLVEKIDESKRAGRIDEANAVESDLLFPVRQRRQDLMTQLAVAVQGYMAMDLVKKNNVELIKGVDRARTTTIFALRTAVIVAQALDDQKLVLDQIDAVNTVTNNTIEQTSIMLRQNTSRVHEQAVNSGVAVETLTKAFDNIYATLDEVEQFKQKANESMAQTINALGNELHRAEPVLSRMKSQEDAVLTAPDSSRKQLGN
jgi:uncharacterized protein YaaN involved in tellurite resistance